MEGFYTHQQIDSHMLHSNHCLSVWFSFEFSQILCIKCVTFVKGYLFNDSFLMFSTLVTDISGAIMQQQARPNKRSGHRTCAAQNRPLLV